MKHLRSLFDLSPDDVAAILQLSIELKQKLRSGDRPSLFQNCVLTLVFEKPSLRTRNSFEAAAAQLGGSSTFFTNQDAGLNGRESVEDIARVIGSYADVVALRTFSQQLINRFADLAGCPVINALSDDRHPCQALTDALTVQEIFGTLQGLKIAYIGDGNNVAASLAIAAAQCGFHFTVASPAGYELPGSFVTELLSRYPEAPLEQTDDPAAAVKEADVVYTDVWASMGQEDESEQRIAAFRDYQVNAELMQLAPKRCRFMHDLPARRGLEVTDEVMESPASIVFQQAENRMHLAKGLLAWLCEHN